MERQVSLQVYRAVRAAHDAATTSLLAADGLDPFTRAVDAGVSANLCEALAGLGGLSGHPYDLSLSLAAVRPGHLRPEPIRFRRIWVTLDDHDYTEAVRAHREMLPVTARGNLIRRGTRLHLAQATGFRLSHGAEAD